MGGGKLSEGSQGARDDAFFDELVEQIEKEKLD
jgi:hypothetical protein